MEMVQFGGGGVPYSWAFGWTTGESGEMVCVSRKVLGYGDAEWFVMQFASPVCSNRILAVLGFAIKWFLVRIDGNVRWNYASVAGVATDENAVVC